MEVEEQNEDWRILCENSLLKNHLQTFEKICEKDNKGNDAEFLNSYLKPFVVLLDSIRSAIELHYSQIDDTSWIDRYEYLVGNVIHPTVLKTGLHKGDFYVHLSLTLPRKLQLKYYDSNTTNSRTLSTDDCIYMCSEEWADGLRKEAKNRFVYSNYVLSTKRGLERKPWRVIFSQGLNDKDFERQKSRQSLYRGDSIAFDLEERETLLAELEEKPHHILDINFEMLHSQIAYLPGTRDKRGGAVIVIPSFGTCWDNQDVSSTELAKLLMYYYQIPRLETQRLGCSLVIDARKGRQVPFVLQCIGEAISLFQEKIPNVVHMAYVITRRDSLLLLMAAGKIRDKLNFQFQLISKLDQLHKDIPQDQLPIELGGSLCYNHEKWVKFRTHLEPFMISCRSAAKYAMTSMKSLANVKLGSTASECRSLLEQHENEVKTILEDDRLTNLKEEGNAILQKLEQPSDDVLKTPDYDDTVECVRNLYTQMNHVFSKVQDFSVKKSQKLETQLNMCIFDEESDKLLNWIKSEGLPFFHQQSDIGDSMGHVTSLEALFRNFHLSAEGTMQQITDMISIGQRLVDSVDLNDNETSWIKERLVELEDKHAQLLAKIEERKKTLAQGVEFFTHSEQASDWSLQCLRFIAQMNMEELQTMEGAQMLKESLETFLRDNPKPEEKVMARMTELAHHLESDKLKMQAGQIIGRCSEVDEMIKKKLKTINGAEKRFQSVLTSESSETSSGIEKDDDLATECGEDAKEQDVSMVGPMFSWKNDPDRDYDENDEILVAFDARITPKLKEKLRFIAEELNTTEKDYVASLKYIITNYVPEMDKRSLPPTLAGKKNILFGNIERIYDFHQRYFSQELENYLHTPLQVGKCFLRWERQFYLYALYNKNKPKSDQLLDDFGNSYFATKQNELKDKLNLSSYLIKPVQRLGKYALLLKDIAKCISNDDPRFTELLAAQDMIKFQLRHGNDLLAMDSIRDCDVNLRSQGCLLRQADFIVFNNKKKQMRKVFLFEDLVLFSKAKKQAVQGDCFVYKDSLKISDVGLTENIGDKGLRFEIWYRRWRKSKKAESYILQAPSKEVKNAWVMDIRKLLLNDRQRSKDYFHSEITTGISIESQPSGLYTDNAIPAYQTHGHTIRSRVETRYKSESRGNNQIRRLSLGSSESTGTSGIHDMNTSNENDAVKTEAKPSKTALTISNSFTFPRKPSFPRSENEERIENSNTANALVDMPFRQLRPQDSDSESSFVRNTIKRRTLHFDFTVEETDGLGRRQIGLSTSNPIHSAVDFDKQGQISTPKKLDEVDEESACFADVADGSGDKIGSSSSGRVHALSVCSLPASPSSPMSPRQTSTPCLVSPDIQTSTASSSASVNPMDQAKTKGEKSKEKGKDRLKKGRRISLGALISRKKKSSSTCSDIGPENS